MTLPHFDITTFPSQLFWLLVAAGLSYIFNKFLFIPYVSKAMDKRKKMLQNYADEEERMQRHIETLRRDISNLLENARLESKKIVEHSIQQSQHIIFSQVQKNNEDFDKKVKEYDAYLRNQRVNLESNIHIVIREIKEKVYNFITMRNI